MSNAKPRVISDYYQLPHLFGFWLLEQTEVEWRSRTREEIWLPHAWLFLGDSTLVQLDFVDEDGTDQNVTRARYASYTIDGPNMYFQVLSASSDGTVHRSETQKTPWAITDDGMLNIKEDEEAWFRYVSANIDDLVAAGFDKEIIDFVLENWEEEEFVIKFTDVKAQELIAEKERRENEEYGF